MAREVRRQSRIGVKEEQDVTARRRGPRVLLQAPALFGDDHTRTLSLGQFRCAVSASAIDNNHFANAAVENVGHGIGDPFAFIQRRDDHRDLRRLELHRVTGGPPVIFAA